MKSAPVIQQSDAAAHATLRVAVLVVVAVTALRVLALAFDRTDLFVDESQYWAWGQSLDWGYFSKPPMIGWVIRAVTEIAGSDAAFWVRLPGPLCHGITALVLAGAARTLWGAPAASATAIGYVTLPMTALGSLLISTDTIMAPFFAGALFFWARLLRGGGRGSALAMGLMMGLAAMSKYAGLYAPATMLLAAALVPAARIGWNRAGTAALVTLVVIAPNIFWNLTHDLTTLSHTADNVDWIKADPTSNVGLHWASLTEFFFSQFGVIGPVVFGSLLVLIFRPKSPESRALLWMSLPIVALICGQALVSRAYANWAVAAYFAGSLAVLPWLATHRRWWRVSLCINTALCLALPLLVVFPGTFQRDGKPLASRYMGRSAISRAAITLARTEGAQGIVARDRDLLADLVHTARDTDIALYAAAPTGAPRHFYEQTMALAPSDPGPLILLGFSAPDACGRPVATLDTTNGAYDGRTISLWRLEGACRDVLE